MKGSNSSTKAIQPKCQSSSGKSAHEASAARFSRAQLLRKGHVTTNPGKPRQNNPGGAVKTKKNGKNNRIKNGVFIDSNVAHISGSKPGVKRKQAKLYKEVQASEEGERASVGVSGSIKAVCGKGPLSLFITRDVEVKIQARVGTSNPPLKGKPSRGPLSADLILQTRYIPVPLNNQSFLPLKVASQPMALLGQTFNRACSLGSFATGSIKQRRLITQLVSGSAQLFPSCP